MRGLAALVVFLGAATRAAADAPTALKLEPVAPAAARLPPAPLTPEQRKSLFVKAEDYEATGRTLVGLGIASAAVGLAGFAALGFERFNVLGCTECDHDALGQDFTVAVAASGVMVGGFLLAWGLGDLREGHAYRRQVKLTIAPAVSTTVAGLALRGRF